MPYAVSTTASVRGMSSGLLQPYSAVCDVLTKENFWVPGRIVVGVAWKGIHRILSLVEVCSLVYPKQWIKSVLHKRLRLHAYKGKLKHEMRCTHFLKIIEYADFLLNEIDGSCSERTPSYGLHLTHCFKVDSHLSVLCQFRISTVRSLRRVCANCSS
jgi:hypothetical protein